MGGWILEKNKIRFVYKEKKRIFAAGFLVGSVLFQEKY
jgi:hypothetical protein